MEAKKRVAEMTGRGEILEKPTVGFLSRVQPEKGASVFFKIAQLIPDALFIVTGKSFSKFIQHQFDNIIYAGFQPRESLPVLYNAFDVYCFPAMSGEETFGLTLLEAMACGVPPVVTDFDGLPEKDSIMQDWIFRQRHSFKLFEVSERKYIADLDCLLTALAKKADIYIPITSQEEKEEMFDFGEIGIHSLEVERKGGQSPLKWMGPDCDGILLLNPQVGELFCFESDLPVIVRWEESRQSKRKMIEFAVSSVGLAKERDALCFTSSWTKEWFSSVLPRNDHFYPLSSGLSLNPSESMNKQSAKKALAQFIENEQFTYKPIIGMIPWMESQKAVPFLLKLAQRNPQLAFLILNSTPIYLTMEKPSNIVSFAIQSLDSYQACTILFKALDLFCFPAALGTPPTLVLEALHCGVAPIVIGGEHLPEELGDVGLLIPSTLDRFGNLTVPMEQLEAAFTKFLADSVEREKCESNAKKVALRFSWDNAAEEVLQLLRHLWRQKSIASKTPLLSLPLVFTYYYDRSSNSISPAAFDLEERTYRPLLGVLLHSLEQRHRSHEIEQVLSAVYPEGFKEEEI